MYLRSIVDILLYFWEGLMLSVAVFNQIEIPEQISTNTPKMQNIFVKYFRSHILAESHTIHRIWVKVMWMLPLPKL